MNWLLQNPLANMFGPYFLIVFGAFVVGGLIVGGVWIWLSDTTRDEDLPHKLPEQPDPYEIAYLRGGAAEVTRLAVFDLLQSRHIEKHEPPKLWGLFSQGTLLRRSASAPETSALTSIQRAAWSWFAVPRLPTDVFQPQTGLSKDVAPLCESYATSLEERRLLETSTHRNARRMVGWTLSLGILGLGGYKLTAALLTGHSNVIFLIVLMVAGLVSTAIVCRRTRLSTLGRRHLESLQLAFGELRNASSKSKTELAAAAGPNPALLLGMGLFGVLALQNTAYSDFYEFYKKSASTSSGCGSSGCGAGGGGCGGGGCGGGGCGGCGGGGCGGG